MKKRAALSVMLAVLITLGICGCKRQVSVHFHASSVVSQRVTDRG